MSENIADVQSSELNGAPSGGDEFADIHSSSKEYADRFQSDSGQWMLRVQEEAVVAFLDKDTVTVLDVGGGHGQIAIPLMEAHRNVTVLGSSPVCSSRLDEHIRNGVISFQVGNLIELPFPDRSFDTVVCFRFVSHCTQWRRLIQELCRVARHSVIVDYPVWTSFNILSPLLFQLKKSVEGNTRTYQLFSNAAIRREFRRAGFKLSGTRAQFFFPMAVHRLLKTSSRAQSLEYLPRNLGLTHLFGSPVIAKFVKR